ncbi:helix-turn-helix domain-containing protein [Cohnella phaseoli]|uniref:Helix-turn-helix protein n=1 Tax=Cohnella phaseoli TaxID=456490 RepID=A0A3D9IFI5_9BACL|nr:AraC family transcriptional regulator [Cohnella phaseoli]RED60544.1 helix-turn-helix protein [Cohnella phaseoli]
MRKGISRDTIEATIVYMKGHLQEKITRDQLAALAGLTPEHYSRVFNKFTGHSPFEYMRVLRVERALELLQRSPIKVKEVARRVGIDDPYYFSRMFKRLTGAAPSASKCTQTIGAGL